jgi:hypothetical protein
MLLSEPASNHQWLLRAAPRLHTHSTSGSNSLKEHSGFHIFPKGTELGAVQVDHRYSVLARRGFSTVDLARLRASTFGVHFVLWITALTLRLVALLTLPVLFITFETVAVDTPASCATFRIVTRSGV